MKSNKKNDSLVYKSPIFSGALERNIAILVAFFLITLGIYYNSVLYFFILFLGVVYMLFFFSRITFFFDRIIIKPSFRLFNRDKIIYYQDCIGLENDNGPRTWNHYSLTYKKINKIKSAGFFIKNKKDVERLITFFESKGIKVKKVKIPNV